MDDGIRKPDAEELALRDTKDRFFIDGKMREEPVTVQLTRLSITDSRRTLVAQQAKREAALEEKQNKVPTEPQLGWPFRITREEAATELIAGDDRTSEYGERIEWVGRNLNSPLARPETAPCNASWSMLIWATDNPKEFFAIERQVMNKRNEEVEAEEALEIDLNKFEDLIGRFSCWRRLDERVRNGDIVLEYD
jgi:hypothetical protein